MKDLKKQLEFGNYRLLFSGLAVIILSLAFAAQVLLGGLIFWGVFLNVFGAVISVLGIGDGIFCIFEFIKERKKLEDSDKLLKEIKKDFCLNDFSLEEYHCEELENEKDLNPYFLIALWYADYCNKKGLDYKESIDVTYNTINGMQRASYTDEEIAEYLMTTMGEDRDNELKAEELRVGLRLTRDMK